MQECLQYDNVLLINDINGPNQHRPALDFHQLPSPRHHINDVETLASSTSLNPHPSTFPVAVHLVDSTVVH